MEFAMPRLRRPLYQRNEGGDEDRWRLVLDTDAKSLFVEHESRRGDMRGSGYAIDTDEIGLIDFLAEGGEAQRELMHLLATLFEDAHGRHRRAIDVPEATAEAAFTSALRQHQDRGGAGPAMSVAAAHP
jgi:hypothetical protein